MKQMNTNDNTKSKLDAQIDKIVDFIRLRRSDGRIRTSYDCEIVVLAFACILTEREAASRMFLEVVLKSKLEVPDDNKNFFHDIDNAVKRLRDKGELYKVSEYTRGLWKITPEGKRRFSRDCPSLFNALLL